VSLDDLRPLVGEWTATVDHPTMDQPVHGRMTVEPLERGGYLIQRSVMDDPVFPAAVSILGPSTMHYFDSRGVRRTYEIALTDGVLTIERSDPDQDFAQRFTGRFSDDGTTITGAWEIDEDGTGWSHDFELTYRRAV
jgi:hypothetical protein